MRKYVDIWTKWWKTSFSGYLRTMMKCPVVFDGMMNNKHCSIWGLLVVGIMRKSLAIRKVILFLGFFVICARIKQKIQLNKQLNIFVWKKPTPLVNTFNKGVVIERSENTTFTTNLTQLLQCQACAQMQQFKEFLKINKKFQPNLGQPDFFKNKRFRNRSLMNIKKQRNIWK